jgi:hypothetical protein
VAVRKALLLASVAVLLGAGAAIAGRYDPHRAIRAADQERARAMLLRQEDLGAGFARQPGGSLVTMPITCKALDESDLTLTAEAGSHLWLKNSMFVFAATRVYASAADANASWRRQTSPAGLKCANTATKNQLGGKASVGLVPYSFPRLAPRTAAFRATLASSHGHKAYEDVIALQHSRGQAFFVVGSAGGHVTRALELRLARIVAARQAKAMRGA